MKVTYDGNGFTGGAVPIDSTNYSAGDYATVKAPGTMIKDGSTFAGWQNLSNTKIYQPRNKMMMHRPTTMQAQWDPACAINYDTLNALNIEGIPPYDGRRYSIGDEAIIPPHDDLTALQAAVGEGDGAHMEGHVSLQGWRIITGAQATREVLKAGDSFTVTGGRVVLQAVWAANEISIAYEINGAEGDTPEIQTALSGRLTTLVEPTCTKAGHYFGGWRDMNTDEIYFANAEVRFMGCTTLEAVWIPLVEYTVHYDPNGASGGEPPADERIYHGNCVYLSAVSELGGIYKTGYTFVGWVLREPEFLVLEPSYAFPVTQNTTFYARWMPNDETLRRHVTYVSDETNISMNDEPPTDYTDYVDGDFATARTWSPLKLGRTVIGWKLGDTIYKFGDLIPIRGNITLVAVWKTNPTVTLKFAGGAAAEGAVDDIICNCAGSYILPDARTFSRDGYFADGWIAPDGSKVPSNTVIHIKFINDEPEVLEYTVNWIDTTPTHTVTYFSIDHDSGHAPVDPCKYHAGEAIPLAPAGDLKKDGFELVGWDDVATGETYSIPSNDEIVAYCNNPDRPDYDSVIPMMWCTRDHMLRAHWVPVAQLFFGSMGASSGIPPDPIRVKYKDSIRIPDKGTLSKTGYTLAGWKDIATDIIYKVGDVYQCRASEVLVLQPVFTSASIVEYIIPSELNIANAAWVPKGGYCINCHSKQVIVPPEMKGNYCWVRSDTGERITETCEIHDIYGDICLTLTPISMSNDGDDRWVWSTHVIAEGLTPMHGGAQRCGDLFEFPKNSGVGFVGWILNNDERRIYQPGEKVRIYGHAQIRAVYPNATHVVTFAYPEGTLAEAPADTEALAEGALYQLPSGEGIRGPVGTKLLYWCGVDQTETENDPDIIRKWYPGEYLRVPMSTETVDGKMLNSSGKLVVYPLFGDKFPVVFADSDGAIMPEDGFTADGVYAEMQAVRTPQITKLDRSAHTDAEWKSAWRIPYRAGSGNAYTYAGMFGEDEEAGNDILSLATVIILGWMFCLAVRYIPVIRDPVKSTIKKTGLPVLTTLEYVLDDETEITKPFKPADERTGFWFEQTHLESPFGHVKKALYRPIGWRYLGGSGTIFARLFGLQYQLHALKGLTEPIIYGPPGTCRWDLRWTKDCVVHFDLEGSMKLFDRMIPGTLEKYKNSAKPQWLNKEVYGENACRQNFVDEHIVRPVGCGHDFKTVNPFDTIWANLKHDYTGENILQAYDRWYPRVVIGEEFHFNEHLSNLALPDSPNEPWIDAVGGIKDPRNTIGQLKRLPDPDDPNYTKYFKTALINKGTEHEQTVYVMYFDLRWLRPMYVEYTYIRGVRTGEKTKAGEIKVTGSQKILRNSFYMPGEVPRVARESDLEEFAPYFDDDDGAVLYFRHWKIRPGSEMYQYYADHNIPERDKEYRGNDKLPYVRVDQPTMILYLDAEYGEHEPEPQPEEQEGLGYGDEDAAGFQNLFDWVFGKKHESKNPKQEKRDLKTINAYSAYQQNAANAQHKAQNGILDKVLTGLGVLAGVASAVAGIFAISTHLKNNAPDCQINKEHEVEEKELEFVNPYEAEEEIEEKPIGELNKEVQQRENEIQEQKNPPIAAPEKEAIIIQKPSLGIAESFHLEYGAAPKPPAPQKVFIEEAERIEIVSAEKVKQKLLHLEAEHVEELAYDDDVETDVEEEAPVVQKKIFKDGLEITNHISQTFGYQNRPKEAEEKKSFFGGILDQLVVMEPMYASDAALVGTPSPHQLQENTAEYVYLKYVPRDPDDPNWYQIGDTVPRIDGMVPVRTCYLTFANSYDDNAPDSETHTEPDEYREPHETFTVPECGAEAPEGMEFAGWILDEDTTTRSIVQPGDTIVQGTCNHLFKALWMPEDPTRFPGLRNPADNLSEPIEEELR